MSEEIESGGIGFVVYLALTGVLLSLFYYFCLTPRPRKQSNILCGERQDVYRHQSVDVRKEKTSGEGAVRRVYNAPKTGDLPAIIITKESPNPLTTQYESFEHGVRTYGKSYDCMGTREYITPTKRGKYIWKNYIEVAELRDAFGRGLIGLGLEPGDRVGIFSKNREEWIISEQACYAHSLVIVSFYDTLGPDAVEYIAGHCEAKVVICANENLKDMMKVVHNCPKLTHVIHFDEFKPDEEIPSEWKKVQMRSYADLIKFGRGNEVVNDHKYAHHPPRPDDLSTIMYTSGTTGAPKGVLLTHANIVSMMNAANIRVEDLVFAGDCYLSYLPLAHILERMVTSMAIFRGVAVGLYSGDTRVLKSDLMELRPTLFCGVPRVFERIFDEIQRTVSGGTPLRKFLFGRAIKAAARARKEGTEPPLLWQVLVLNKLKKVLGGRVRLMLSGGAPLSPNIHEFLITAFQIPIIQAYGLTETCAGATIAFPKDTQGSIGHVGSPVHCCEIKLLDVSEMGYTSADTPCPRGEVLLKGPHVSTGYYKDAGKTQESFRDGWFYTGDIGRWNEDGTMSIIDRKKNIFKLSHGEYVAAEKLEGVYANCDLVSQIWVYGDSEKSALVAVVVPKEGKVKGKLSDAKTREQVLSALNKVGDENKVRGFEKLFGVWLTDEEFTDKNNLATPTLKLKRHELKKKFEDEIASMYEDIAKKGEAGSGTRRK